MEQFDYLALDASGQRHKGVLAAESAEAVGDALASRQWQVVRVRKRVGAARGTGRRRRPADAQVRALLVDELATLLESGVPLAEALASLARGGGAAESLGGVLARVRGGESFSSALTGAGFAIPDYVIQLVRAGEATGNLAAALRAAAEHLEADRQFTQDARSALIYPAVLVASGIVATLVMFVFVVPRFASILDDPRADLPWISQWVLAAGLWLTQHQLAVALTCAAAVAALAYAARQPRFRVAAWELASTMPLIGRWIAHAELARWAGLLGVLLHSRVPLLTALSQANSTFRRQALRARAELVLADVRGGKTLSQALAQHGVLEATGLNLVQVGERVGALASTVSSLARMHANQSRTLLKRFLILLEPVTILAISIVLGGIMISVMLAITSLTNVL